MCGVRHSGVFTVLIRFLASKGDAPLSRNDERNQKGWCMCRVKSENFSEKDCHLWIVGSFAVQMVTMISFCTMKVVEYWRVFKISVGDVKSRSIG